MALGDRLAATVGPVATMTRARLIAPMRPDKYLRIAAAMQRENMGITSGFAGAAQRCPDRPGLVDELGTLSWCEIDQRADGLAAALQAEATPKVIGIMAPRDYDPGRTAPQQHRQDRAPRITGPR